jgi:hypothetical protein
MRGPGRLFQLVFSTKPAPSRKGKQNAASWSISLLLCTGSPPTFIDSRLLIPDPSFDSESRPELKRREKPTITLRLKTASQALAAPPLPLYPELTGPKGARQRREERERWRREEETTCKEVVVNLGDSLMGDGLMYA